MNHGSYQIEKPEWIVCLRNRAFWWLDVAPVKPSLR